MNDPLAAQSSGSHDQNRFRPAALTDADTVTSLAFCQVDEVVRYVKRLSLL